MFRFWEKVYKTDTCWLWQGYRMPYGYGQIRVKGKTYLTHRFVWFLTYGYHPDELFVCHHCDNPPCVNPEHLFLGTPADNSADMALKGRANKEPRPGSGRPREIQDSKVIDHIRLLYSLNLSQQTIANEYNVTRQVIRNIVNHKHGYK